MGYYSRRLFLLIIVMYWSRNFGSSPGESKQPNHEINSDSWVDPSDMLSTDLSSFTTNDQTIVHKQEDDKDVTAESADINNSRYEEGFSDDNEKKCDLPHFKQLARVIMESFPNPGKRYLTLELSDEDLKTLQEFKEDPSGEKISDISELLARIFQQFEQDGIQEQMFFSRMWKVIVYNKEIFTVVFIISILISLLIFQVRTSIPWYRQLWYIFKWLFIISLPWEWLRLYYKEFAKKQAELTKTNNSSCHSATMTFISQISFWVASKFTWREDECLKFYEAYVVDSFWEVPPSLAFSFTVTRLVFEPFMYIADACGRSLNAFLKHVPTLMQPVMLVVVVGMLLFCLLLLAKFRIKLAFFEIGPAAATQVRLEGNDMNALRDCIRKEIREIAPVRNGNVEELPRIKRTADEERADGKTKS